MTRTIPNLLAEMDATGVSQTLVLPIAFALSFGDDLTERCLDATEAACVQARLLPAASVHPRDPAHIEKLRRARRPCAEAPPRRAALLP